MNLISSIHKTISGKRSLPAIVAGSLAFILYTITMPITVQEGDTAELVLAGVNFSLVHPPGYPLQVLYNFVLTKTLFFLNPYQASSIGSIILASISTYLIASCAAGWRGCLVAILWATSFLAWKWAVLPDVFSGLIFFSMLFLYLLNRKELITTPFTFLLALSVLHHQLIIFLLPVLLYSWWPHRLSHKNNFRILIFGTIALCGYSILFLVDDARPGSWGVVDNFTDLWKHFTRHDYGTTSLSAHERDISIIHNLSNFVIRFLESFWSLFPIGLIVWYTSSKKITHEVILILSIIAIYLGVVVFRSSLNTDVFGIATLERFFLLPFLLILFLTFLLYKKSKYEKIVIGLLVLNIISNLLLFSEINFYRFDTRVHDYSMSMLKQTPERAVLWVSGDTEINATRYLQEVEGHRKDITLMSSLDLVEKDFNKVARNAPYYFKNGNSWHQRIIWSVTPFYSNDLNIPGSNYFDKTVSGLIAKYTQGEGRIKFECLDKSSYYTQSLDDNYLERPDIRSALVFNYGNCHLNEAHQAMKDKDWRKLKSLMLAGLEIVNPHPLLQLQLCLGAKLSGEEVSECEEKAADIFTKTHSAYLPKELGFK